MWGKIEGVFKKTSCLVGVFFFLMVFFWEAESWAHKVFVFNFDGSIVEDRVERGGTFDVSYRLYRVNFLGSAFQSGTSGPAYIDIPSADWKKLTTPTYDPITKHPTYPIFLARGEGKLGSLIPFQLSDGRTFIPGHYKIVNPGTFAYLNESSSENYFERQFSEAFKRSKRGIGTLEGEAFHAFYQAVNNPETRDSVYVVSSRGHSQEEIYEKLKNDRDVRRLIKKSVTDAELRALASRHIMLLRQEYQHFDNNMGVVDLKVVKARYVLEIAKSLTHANPSDYLEILSSDGERLTRGVELNYFESHYENLEGVREGLQDLVNRVRHLKVVIHNSGTPEEIRVSEKPKTYVLTPYSQEREIVWRDISENQTLRMVLPKTMVSGLSCKSYFGGL